MSNTIFRNYYLVFYQANELVENTNEGSLKGRPIWNLDLTLCFGSFLRVRLHQVLGGFVRKNFVHPPK